VERTWDIKMKALMWLYSFDNFVEVYRYDYKTKVIVKFTKSDLVDKTIEFDGMLSKIGDNLFLLFKNNGSLIFIANENEILIDDDVLINVTGKPSDRVLTILKKGKFLFEVHYSLVDDKSIEGDLTPFAEEEDFDFGLFVSNISMDKRRQKVFLGKE